jgi:hypothetical protein
VYSLKGMGYTSSKKVEASGHRGGTENASVSLGGGVSLAGGTLYILLMQY